MKGSFFVAFVGSILVLMFAEHAFADGTYLRTDDRRKTLVWNNDPQPGDAATWTGNRDSEGYAEGPGTLTWLRPQKQFSTGSNILSTKKVPLSSLTGTMTHGKFEGAVTTVNRGKTYYAKYVDGQRKGNWSSGPIIAKASKAESPTTAETPKTAPASEPKVASAAKTESSAESKISDEAEPEPPTEGPDEASAEIKSQKSETVGSKPPTPLIAQASETDESATPRQQPVTKKAALAPGAVRAIDQPGRQIEKKTEKPAVSAPKIRKATKVEQPKPAPTIVERESESPAEGPSSGVVEKPQTPNPKPAEPKRSQLSTSNSKLSPEETPVDDSIRTLTGPPTSLRSKSAPSSAATPEVSISAPSIAPASAPAAAPKLNAVQAMDIADIQARTDGYDLGEYQLPKAEYNASDDTWSVSYLGRDKEKAAKHLSVIVQDKSGKAAVKK